MKLTALSRTIVKPNHALITGDGFVNSVVPGWKDCTVNVVINKAMGADFCQQMVTMTPSSSLCGQTRSSQLFVYVIEGRMEARVDGSDHSLSEGSYLWIPPGNGEYVFDRAEEGTRILTFQKEYEYLEHEEVPSVLCGDAPKIEKEVYMDDPSLLMQNLLPDHLGFDMAVNIFTYMPGGNLPFVETHVMEHGLLYLAGQGIYRLDDEWYPVQKGDSIWMAPYCPQWFVAMGKEPAVYIYYKNVNRANITI